MTAGRAAVVAALLAAACGGEGPVAPRAPAAPLVTSAIVRPNVANVLGVRVAVTAVRADSVAVRYRFAGQPATADAQTPALPVSGEILSVPVLGLFPEREYELRAVAWGAGGTAVSEPLAHTTPALPADLPRYKASGDDPSPGYVVFAAGNYGIVIDNTGRVVWYRAFPEGVGLSFMAEPDGRYAARPPTAAVGDIESWIEVDPTGDAVRVISCARGLQPRLHDLIVDPDGAVVLLCDETRTMDLSAVGGNAAARVTGTVVQRLDIGGSLRFEWSPFDHFAVTDLAAAERSGPTVNWTHGNAIERDRDGNYLVSFRSLGEITKIDAASGQVLWRLGGPRNQFTFVGAETPAFVRQHSVRVDATGELLLLDNLGTPSDSRAERYLLDVEGRVARLTQSHSATPGVVTEIGGSVQSLPGGRTLVSFGTAGRVEEYDAAGRVVWRIEGNPGYVFRAQRIRSLYQPGVGSAR